MYKTNKSLALLFIILIAVFGNAQKKTIIGKVTTYKTIPIQNAKISVKKTQESTVTNKLGYFTIECDAKDKLSIKVEGFKSKTIKLKNRKDSLHLDLFVDGDESNLDLAAEKGHLNNITLAEAKKRFNTKVPYSHGFTNILELIKNKFPQAIVSKNDIIFRGFKSATGDAGTGVLFAINGVTVSMEAVKGINITEIKNIKLVTGSKAMIYGTGAGNGVLAIELNSD